MDSTALHIFYRYFQGALLLQSLVFLCIFIIYRRKEFLYYMLYLIVLFVYYGTNASELLLEIPPGNPTIQFFWKYLNMPLVMLFNIFYLLFITTFLGLEKYRDIFLVIKILMGMIGVSFFLFLVFRFSGIRVNIIFNIVNITGLAGGIILAVLILRRKVPYGKFIAAGIFLYTSTSIASASTVIISKSNPDFFLAKAALLYVKIGVLADMILYFIALFSKWIATEKELVLSTVAGELKVANERDRIKRDFHDEIGASLSGIAMYSHLGISQIKANQLAEAEKTLSIMQQSSAEIIEKLNDIVWLINPGHHSLQQLMQRLEDYAAQMAAAKNMQFQSNINGQYPVFELSTELRRNIYLLFKEAVNNAVKYSQATLLELMFWKEDDNLLIQLKDNGTGFDPGTVKRGNGLNNMQQRAKEAGIQLRIVSGNNEGTSITAIFKIP